MKYPEFVRTRSLKNMSGVTWLVIVFSVVFAFAFYWEFLRAKEVLYVSEASPDKLWRVEVYLVQARIDLGPGWHSKGDSSTVVYFKNQRGDTIAKMDGLLYGCTPIIWSSERVDFGEHCMYFQFAREYEEQHFHK